MKHQFLIISLCYLLISCTIPGTNLNTYKYQTINAKKENNESPSAWSKIIRITPDLLAKSNKNSSSTNKEKHIPRYEYKIGPSDVIKITVWNHPELTNPGNTSDSNLLGTVVRSDGNIFYPYIGLVKASGLTVEQLREAIVKKLSKYIKQPQLEVNILAFNSAPVYILGAVNKPQVIKLNLRNSSLADSLARSGGINEATANPQGVFVIRKVIRKTKLKINIYQLDITEAPSLILAEQFKLKAQDVVYVTSSPVSLWNRELNNLLPSLNTYQAASLVL